MKTHYKGMTYDDAQHMRHLYWRAKWTQKRIAAHYGVGQNTVSRIISEITWCPPIEESWVARMPPSLDMRGVRSGNWRRDAPQ